MWVTRRSCSKSRPVTSRAFSMKARKTGSEAITLVGLHDADVEATPRGRDSNLRRRQRDACRLAIKGDEVHVVVDPEQRAPRAAVPAGGVELMSGAQEVVRLARPDAVRLGERLEGR